MATCEFITDTHIQGVSNPTTFSTISLGAADANRYIIVVVQNEGNTGVGPIGLASATIGGVAATLSSGGSYGGSGTDGTAQIMWAKVPTGTTGDIVITWSGSGVASCIIGVYRVIADSISNFDSDGQNEGTNDPINLTLDVEAGGFIIGFLDMQDSAPASGTWSIDGNASTNYQRNVGNGSALFGSAGVWNFAAGDTGVVASCDRSDTTNNSTATAVAFSVVEAVTDLSINVSDSVSITESVLITQVNNVSVFDAISLAEAVTMTLISNINVNDAVSIAEDTSFLLNPYAVSVSDDVAITESVVASNPDLGDISVSDVITLTESVSLTAHLGNIIVNDTITISEMVSVATIYNLSVSDSISITESVVVVRVDARSGIAHMRGKGNDHIFAMDPRVDYEMKSNQQNRPLGMDDKTML